MQFPNLEEKMRSHILFIATAALLASQAGFAQSPCSPAVPDDVCSVEQMIYVQTDFKNTDQVRLDMTSLKQLLMKYDGGDATLKEHILGLVDQVVEQAHEVRAPRDILAQAAGKENLTGIYDALKAYEDKNGDIVPLDWKVPAGIRYLVFDNNRKYKPATDRMSYDFGFFTVLDKGATLEQLQLIRYPSEVLIDKQSGIGEWDTGTLIGGYPYISIGSGVRDHLAKDGLYLLNIKMPGQPLVNGWFIVSRGSSTADPSIQSPTINATTNRTPTLTWTDFKSPEFRLFEQRKRVVRIHREDVEEDRQVFHQVQVYPDATQTATVGQNSMPGDVSSLSPGTYSFTVNFEERWFMGGLLVGRNSYTTVPFSVLK
jgi:hypothetical protein